jgi:hypothetical protein
VPLKSPAARISQIPKPLIKPNKVKLLIRNGFLVNARIQSSTTTCIVKHGNLGVLSPSFSCSRSIIELIGKQQNIGGILDRQYWTGLYSYVGSNPDNLFFIVEFQIWQ